MAEKILVIDDDVDTLKLVGMMLQRQGYQVIFATNGQQGLTKAIEEEPDLILLDIMMPDVDGYEVARQLRQNPATMNTPILMFTAKTQLDDKVAGFEVGADDYLTKPTHPSELHAHVKALLSRAPKTLARAPAASQEQAGYMIGILAARGGLGVTTLAVNLGVILYNKTKEEVIVAELRPGQGTLDLDLGIPESKELVEMLSSNASDITNHKVREALVKHSSGVKFLLASHLPSDMHLVGQVGQYEILFNRLAALGRFVILDLGTGLPLFVQKLLPLCNEKIIVIESAPNSITHTKALINDIARLGIDKRGVVAVLNNRIRSELQLTMTQVQERLGFSVAATFSPAPELHFQATRAETPAVLSQPDSQTTQQFNKLADLIIERKAQAK